MAAARDDAATVTSPADFERFQGLTVTHKFLPNEHARIILCCKCLQRSEVRDSCRFSRRHLVAFRCKDVYGTSALAAFF